ncbi:MAG: hypothetical protein ACK415_01740 [Thermodesulfovibrionales bacterium]
MLKDLFRVFFRNISIILRAFSGLIAQKGDFKLLSLLTLLFVFFSFSIFAQEHRTPYGDYQEWCGAYGVCKNDMSAEDAETAITRYFSSKGLRVGRIQHRGRFVEAEIYRNGRLTDRIIFDRKTGRMRSAY